MKRKLIRALSLFMGLMLLSQSVLASGDPNIDGGGGGMGTGTNTNVWTVRSDSGRAINQGDGLRVYLVNPSTGVPVSASIDITNSNVARTEMRNGRGKTKFEYKYVDSSLSNFDTEYQYIRVDNSQKLPRIVPSSASNNTARIDAIKDWFLTQNHADWIFGQLGTDIDEVRAGGYLIAIEPIAYFRHNGLHYAMTATEAALFDRTANGRLRNTMGPLTHRNLPLAIFLEDDEFVGSSYQINAWTGSRTANASNTNIIDLLGIGYIRYFPVPTDTDPGTADFAYPTDTWVVTSFRMCNIRRSGSSWVDASAITLNNPASARVTIGSTEYNISNIYIPSGGEQLIWVKWKTPSTPQTMTASASPSTGFLQNRQSTGINNRYVSSITANITIYSNDMESEPPDPTLDDTASSIGYSALDASRAKSGILGINRDSNSWHVWDCVLHVEYVNGEPRYSFRFHRIVYTAQIRTSYINMTPDIHCPTAYTRNYRTYMKSGYGVNLETETNIRITMLHEGTRATTTTTYTSPASTSFAAAPQYVFAQFREFNYGGYERQLELFNNRFVFKRNRFSTYNSRVHYTPWWVPDGTEYDIITRSDFAYTPTGKLAIFGISNAITIEGNIYDDWRIAPIR